MSGFRLDHRGRVERDEPLAFVWNGRPMRGFKGDTLASALLANGVSMVGRSFKYHRPRGIVSAGQEESGALVTIGEGAARTPNLKPSTVELEPGMVVTPQNVWPTLGFDVGEVNDRLAPFLAAGFYYKTFMGVLGGTREWMFWERFIRQAAGLGAASPRADPDWYEHVHGHCDVLVIGSGAAGISAALEAGEAGLDVVLAEQDFEFGGDLLTDGRIQGHAAEWWRVETMGTLRAMPNVRLMNRTMAFGVYDHGVVGLTERAPGGGGDGPLPRERMHVLRTRRIVVAAGGVERGIAFGDNDRPGVMGADAARAYAERFGAAPGRRVVVATTNDSGYRAAGTFADDGLDVVLIDSREAPPEERMRAAEERGVEVMTGVVPVRALGRSRVRGLQVGRHKGGGRAAPTQRLDCDVVAVSGGWAPTLHLTSHARARPVWSAENACFLPGEAKGVLVAGAAAGVWKREDCAASGRAAGRAAAVDLGATSRRRLKPTPAGGWDGPIDPVFEVTTRVGKLKSFVDLANDVTADDLRLAHREGFESSEHMKRYTTLGMAPDQGKTSNVIGLAVMAAARGIAPEAQGTTTFRPPYAPVSIGVFAGGEQGRAHLPVRRSPFHARIEAAGGAFVNAGLWKRSFYFPRKGEGLGAASAREAATVRRAVGMCDVSSLGKALVQGPDAAAFLDRVYSNLMSTLKIGRARYGFMLREDGLAWDDGTVWRFGRTEFLVTATTGRADQVVGWLDRWLQAEWPELRVAVTDVTEAWAGLAVAGPRARAALARVAEGDVSDAALPFMGVAEMPVAGLPARVARISFSGELGYEVYVRSPEAERLWDALKGAVEAEGGGPYGLEALDILRVEKGHVTHREIDGRVTLADLGMPRMASARKPFIGSALLRRPGLEREDRRRLVGLEPVEPGARVQAGAILCRPGRRRGHGVGHVTSVADSPTVGRRIALGFAEGGLAAFEGEELVAMDPTAKRETRLRVVSPGFVDPEGERLRG